MKKSDTIAEIVKALAKAQGQFKIAAYDKKNPHFKSSYASLESVHSAIREGLVANGLAICHLLEDGKMVTTLFHESGEWIGCELSIPAGLSPQQLGSALTYFRRYSICCLLAIPSGEDDDGNSAQEAHVAPALKLSDLAVSEIGELINGDIDLLNKILSAYKAKHLNDIDAIHYQKIIDRLKIRRSL